MRARADDPPSMTPERFRELAVAELTPLHRFARHLVHADADADDLVQQTYVRAFEAWGTFAGPSAGIRPWLFKILHNIHRARARPRGGALIGLDERAAALEADDRPEGTPGAGQIDWQTVGGRLTGAVAGLKEELREVFLLHACEGLKYREIAEVVGVPVGTVMSRLSRARRRLVDALQGDPPVGGNSPPEVRIVPRGGAANRHD